MQSLGGQVGLAWHSQVLEGQDPGEVGAGRGMSSPSYLVLATSCTGLAQ